MKTLQLGLVGVLLFCNISSGLAVNSAAANEAVNVHAKDLRQLFDQRFQAAVKAVDEWYPKHVLSSDRPIFPEEFALVEMDIDVVPCIIQLLEREIDSPFLGTSGNEVVVRVLNLICDNPSLTFNCERKDKAYDRKAELRWYVQWWKRMQLDPGERRAFLITHLTNCIKIPHRAKYKDDAKRHMKREGWLKGYLSIVVREIEAGDERFIPLVDEIMETKVCGDNPTREQILVWWEANKDKITSETTATPAAK